MRNQLSTIEQTDVQIARVREAAESAKTYAGLARAKNTDRAYRSDWNDFELWAKEHGLSFLPASPSTVSLYLAAKAITLKTSSLSRRLTAIRQAHQLAGLELNTRHPAITEVWKGIRNSKGISQQGKSPIVTDELRSMIDLLNTSTLQGARDTALLLIGFAGAFRRSELVSIDVSDISIGREGVTIRVARSKTDQEGAGRDVGIPYGSNPSTCPVRALQDWLNASSTLEGPLFRAINKHGQIQTSRLSDKAVALIVKRTALALAKSKGLKWDVAEAYAAQFSGHSLRAGLATSAAMAGVAEHTIMRQTGHKKAETLRKYIRMGTLFQDNAASKVGL